MNFRTIATAARNNSTPENVLALVEAYAVSGCATYPVDGELFFSTYMGTAPAGYVFKACETYDGEALTVERVPNLDALTHVDALRAALAQAEESARADIGNHEDRWNAVYAAFAKLHAATI